MQRFITDERTGIRYELIGDYYYPCLTVEESPTLSKYGRLRERYLREHTPEIKDRIKTESNYRLVSNIKTDKDGDTIIVLYVSHAGSNEKVQYFIKPEKGQLTSDHKDLDPAKIISKIEVTLSRKNG